MTIKEIAKLANTSRGTVDRVVNGRGKVNKELQAKILQIIKETNYRPNDMARMLALANQQVNIGVVIGSLNNLFFEIVKEGIIYQTEKFRNNNMTLIFKEVDMFNKKMILDSLDELEKQDISGLIISSLTDVEIMDKIEKLKIPVVVLSNDLDLKQNKISFVGCDYYNSGALAASLANLMLEDDSKVGIVAGSLNHKGQKERYKGFTQKLNPSFNIKAVVENYDDNTKSYILTKKLISDRQIDLIYFLGAGIDGGLQAIKESKKKIKIITVDQTEEIEKGLASGFVSATVAQHPFSQGTKSIETIHDFIYKTRKIKSVNIMENSIYLKESIIPHHIKDVIKKEN